MLELSETDYKMIVMFKEKTDKLEIMCSDRVKYNQQIFKRSKWNFKSWKNKIVVIQIQRMDLVAK